MLPGVVSWPPAARTPFHTSNRFDVIRWTLVSDNTSYLEYDLVNSQPLQAETEVASLQVVVPLYETMPQSLDLLLSNYLLLYQNIPLISLHFLLIYRYVSCTDHVKVASN
ncbi:hypothetical protein EB796_023763 [Bugula neritina]|uniref:Uncharacterized protein n=1 Tax=Bugula neritina TaxID=10212 RepID=A0A7J7IXE8_BUGNE|nr:hypothetical protein EB796_023763 [Bugula neritina]